MHNTFVSTLIRRNARGAWKVDLFNAALRALGRGSRLVAPTTEMASVESRLNVFHLAAGVLEFGVPGDFAEVGCNDGETSVLLQRIIQHYDPKRRLHVYDSFQGAPDGAAQDEGAYAKGDMATSRERVVAHFERAGLPLPEIHPGWFEDTLPRELPDAIAFALVDGDLYQSTRTALTHVYPRVVPRGVLVFGCYCDPAVYVPRSKHPGYLSPGVRKACDEFFSDKPEAVSVLYAGDYTIGYVRKE